MGMFIVAYDPFIAPEQARDLEIELAPLDDVYSRADFLTVHTPLTPETRGLIDAQVFAKMKKGARVINCARGGLIDEQALGDAIANGTIAGAALDVFSQEPPPPDHPLLQFDNVVASPHTAGVTKEARANMGKFAAEQLILTLDGKRPPRMVNPEVWPAYAKRFERTFGIRPGT